MDKQDKTAEDFFKLKCDEQWAKRQGVFADPGTLPKLNHDVLPAIYSLMESYAQHRTAELEAKIKALEEEIKHLIISDRNRHDECVKYVSKIQALEERLEAADEIINLKPIGTWAKWNAEYSKLLEKYQSLKQ